MYNVQNRRSKWARTSMTVSRNCECHVKEETVMSEIFSVGDTL